MTGPNTGLRALSALDHLADVVVVRTIAVVMDRLHLLPLMALAQHLLPPTERTRPKSRKVASHRAAIHPLLATIRAKVRLQPRSKITLLTTSDTRAPARITDRPHHFQASAPATTDAEADPVLMDLHHHSANTMVGTARTTSMVHDLAHVRRHLL